MLKFFKYFISILIILVLNINVSFAATILKGEELAQFKSDMSEAILVVINNDQAVQNIYNNTINLHSNCNNTNKCSNTITQNAYKLSYIDKYNPLLEVIRKYNIDIPDDENEYDFIYKKILKKYKIEHTNEYKQFVNDINNKQAELLKISHNMQDYTKEHKYDFDDNSYLDNTHVPAAEMEEQNIINQNNINDEENQASMIILIGIIAIILALTYFLPSTVAILKRHKNTCAVIVLNIFLGWTFLGWVIALVWACCNTDKSNS